MAPSYIELTILVMSSQISLFAGYRVEVGNGVLKQAVHNGL